MAIVTAPRVQFRGPSFMKDDGHGPCDDLRRPLRRADAAPLCLPTPASTPPSATRMSGSLASSVTCALLARQHESRPMPQSRCCVAALGSTRRCTALLSRQPTPPRLGHHRFQPLHQRSPFSLLTTSSPGDCSPSDHVAPFRRLLAPFPRTQRRRRNVNPGN